MKKSYTWLIVSLIAVIVPSFIIPLKVGVTLLDKISLGATLAGTLGTIATLIIAFVLYDRFKVDQKIMDEQAIKMIELWAVLKTLSFSIEIPGFVLFLNLNTFSSKKQREFYKIFVREKSPDDRDLKFEESYNEYLTPFFDLVQNEYVPMEVKTSILLHQPAASAGVDDNGEPIYAVVTPSGVERNSTREFELIITRYFATTKEKKATLYNFVDGWMGVIIIVENWIKKNAPASAKSLGFD